MEVLSPDTRTDTLENFIFMEKHELAYKNVGANTSVVFHFFAWAGGCTNNTLIPIFRFDGDTLMVSFDFKETDSRSNKGCNSENLIRVSYLIEGKPAKVYFYPTFK